MARNQSTSAAELFVGLAGAGPAHRQLGQALRTAIQEGRLQPSEPLPSSRLLAADLGLSRWVVTEAYTQLIAEGYLTARPGSATRVAARAVSSMSPAAPGVRPERGFEAAFPHDVRQLDLRPGSPDIAAFPRVAWARAYTQVLRQTSAEDLGSRPGRDRPRCARPWPPISPVYAGSVPARTDWSSAQAPRRA
jgi:Transcriptional regulators containing a DNA-binding HTH domain and an aminotransferase domain (MocR family) and their eukaryotic orthologs